MIESILKKSIEPWLLGVASNWEESNIPRGFLVLRLDAHKAKDLSGFYSEASSVFNFPEYFGSNLNALDECLTDLEWLPAEGYILVIDNAESMLVKESDETLEGVLAVFRDAGEEWAKPVRSGEAWDRKAKPFHAVLRIAGVADSNTIARFVKSGVYFQNTGHAELGNTQP